MLVLLLLLIPIFCMSVSIYASMLYLYVQGDTHLVPMLISIFLVVIIGYVLPRIFYKLYKSNTASSLNAEKKVILLSNYISYIVLLAFGISLLIRCIKNDENVLEIYLAGGIVFLFIYITYAYFIGYQKLEWTIIDVTEKNKKTNILMIENKEYGLYQVYTNSSDKYEVGKRYTFKFNPNSKIFKIKNKKKNKK